MLLPSLQTDRKAKVGVSWICGACIFDLAHVHTVQTHPPYLFTKKDIHFPAEYCTDHHFQYHY